MKRVSNKVAVVTGGARGIGRACCLRLAEEGAAVAVTDLIDDEGQAVVDEITQAGGQAAYWHLDVTDESEWQRVLAETSERFGGVDGLVNNAGIAGINESIENIPQAEWEKVMKVNVTGVFLGTKHAIPHLRKRGGGSIINLSSIYGIIGAGDIPPYHASKGAVRTMTKNDAIAYAPEGIRVNSVHPGYIWTPLVEDFGQRLGFDAEAFQQELGSRHPVGHVGEPDDIAWGIVYLLSDESKFMTGSELVIDGGYTAW
ncbi:MAG: glucose 1-dehydrogenase [Halofilum sp. (in: g-proteobacteria)]|nr:glucose 1-dehydrogenase [Halofilum sp. (in: g-proteobacteria)]